MIDTELCDLILKAGGNPGCQALIYLIRLFASDGKDVMHVEVRDPVFRRKVGENIQCGSCYLFWCQEIGILQGTDKTADDFILQRIGGLDEI